MVEVPSFEPDPTSKRCLWRESYEADLYAAEVEINRREEEHSAYLDNFL
jgi:hypothetical protein